MCVAEDSLCPCVVCAVSGPCVAHVLMFVAVKRVARGRVWLCCLPVVSGRWVA